MLRKNFEADWQRKKRYLDRSMFEEPSALSPIPESQEPPSRGASPYGGTDLPELIVESVPRRDNGESAIYYHHLRKRMRRYYRRIFNLRTDEDSSGTEFDEAVYDEYNPEYINVRYKHQDDFNVCHTIEEFDAESDLREDLSKKEIAGTSETLARNDESHVQASGSKRIDDHLMESFTNRDENDVNISTESSPNISDSQDINLRLSEEQVEIHQSGLSEIVNMDLSVMQESRNSNERIIETIEKFIESEETEIHISRKKTDKDGDGRKYVGHGDMEGEIQEYHSHSEEKSDDEDMGTEEGSEQLGESQDGDDETKEYHSHSEEESGDEEIGTEEESEQLGESQDIEDEEEAEEDDSEEMEKETEEVEVMRSYNPEPFVDSLLYEPPSDIEENTSLNLATHKHSLPRDEASSFKDTTTPEEIDAADHDDEFHPMLRTSTPKSKEYAPHTGTKRSSKPAPGDGMPAAKKRSFRNIYSTEKYKNISLQTDSKLNRHFGVQTEERRNESKNESTQTNLQQGVEYRSIGIQVSLRNESPSIEIETERHPVRFNTVEMQTDETQAEQQDAHTQTGSGHQGVDIGIQTDERNDGENLREDDFRAFFERRAIFFFFF